MKVWTDKEGKKLTASEFSARFKQGVQAITPFQQAKISLFGIILVLTGIVVGIITSIITKQWWLLIILVGSLIITWMQMIGSIQKYLILNDMEKIIAREVNYEEIKSS